MNAPERSPDEEVSAFVDGELRARVRDRIVGTLYGDPELRRTWARFHLIGDVLRGAGPVPGAGSIAGKVGEALSGERVVPFEPRARRVVPGALAGAALAASVAALAILGVRSLDDGSDPHPPAAGASRYESVAGAAPIAADPAPPRIVTASASPPPLPASPRRSAAEMDAAARLNAYLVNHNEYAGNGVLPYVRIVGYQSAAGGYR